MRTLRWRIAQLAAAPSTVLLLGETGTGKGLAARLLHALSARSRQPFVHVDCAALPESVIESELFGHERGAFTGAIGRRTGRLEAAGEGTLFLDEIGELPPAVQAKLLRALQDRVFERVGGSAPLPLRARIVAATNVDLPGAVAEGAFRADLYFRLRVAAIRLPPLRERLEDVPELVEHLLSALCLRLDKPRPAPAPAFLERLAGHPWPGNVRELQNVLEHALVLGARGRLGAEALDGLLDEGLAPGAQPPRLAPPPASTAEARRIGRALRQAGGNVSRTARRLGLSRSALRRRIRRYGLEALIPRD
jgi:DNA-binding NtrC family response regulator